MTSQDLHKPNLPLLLQNEMDILLAQIRLMELYVKQAQERAAAQTADLEGHHREQTAALHKRVVELESAIKKMRTSMAGEIEAIRQGFESELTKLRAKLRIKDQALARAQETLSAAERSSGQLRGWQGSMHEARPHELGETEPIGAGAESETLSAPGVTHGKPLVVRERSIAELERHVSGLTDELHRAGEEKQRLIMRTEHERQEYRFRSAALQERVASLEREARQSAAALANKNELELRFRELVEQNSRLELMQRQTERLLAAQAEQIRAGVRVEIERLEGRMREKETELRSSQASAQESQERERLARARLEQSLAEAQLLMESRKAEIADLRAQIAALNEHPPSEPATGPGDRAVTAKSRA